MLVYQLRFAVSLLNFPHDLFKVRWFHIFLLFVFFLSSFATLSSISNDQNAFENSNWNFFSKTIEINAVLGTNNAFHNHSSVCGYIWNSYTYPFFWLQPIGLGKIHMSINHSAYLTASKCSKVPILTQLFECFVVNQLNMVNGIYLDASERGNIAV